MSASRRVQRVEREIQQIVASYLLSGFNESFSALVSITRAQVSPDLRLAKVYVSLMGEDEACVESFDAINERRGEIQRFLGSQLNTKFCPKISFYVDKSHEKIEKVERILRELKNK